MTDEIQHVSISDTTCSCGWEVDGFTAPELWRWKLDLHIKAPGRDTLTDTTDAQHLEELCHRCGGPNVAWSAPSPLWNEVMRGGDIAAADSYDGIICPTCFAILANQAGLANYWRFHAPVVTRELTTVTPDERVWDDQAWLWIDPSSIGIEEETEYAVFNDPEVWEPLFASGELPASQRFQLDEPLHVATSLTMIVKFIDLRNLERAQQGKVEKYGYMQLRTRTITRTPWRTLTLDEVASARR